MKKKGKEKKMKLKLFEFFFLNFFFFLFFSFLVYLFRLFNTFLSHGAFAVVVAVVCQHFFFCLRSILLMVRSCCVVATSLFVCIHLSMFVCMSASLCTFLLFYSKSFVEQKKYLLDAFQAIKMATLHNFTVFKKM